mmetsp:Transcript_10096/g.36899  ORF Transcript_10096/g.36899 Transcript_10096/m.36899 type:complete len:94 (-) Transcript_10096:2144-2425(-)
MEAARVLLFLQVWRVHSRLEDCPALIVYSRVNEIVAHVDVIDACICTSQTSVKTSHPLERSSPTHQTHSRSWPSHSTKLGRTLELPPAALSQR